MVLRDRYLIEEFTSVGQTIADPFCGSGVVLLEAVLNGRKAIAGDWNPYGYVLTYAQSVQLPSTSVLTLIPVRKNPKPCRLCIEQ